MAGSWYSTRQVGKSATLPWRLPMRTFGRLANQVEKRCLANGGSNRTLETPAVFSITLRIRLPCGAPMALLTNPEVVPTLPIASV